MGSQDAKGIDKRDAARASKEKARETGSARLERMRGKGSPVGGASWGLLDPRWIAALVSAVTGQGAAIMLSVTSDGGALAITIYDNGDRERFYLPMNDQLESELETLIGYWQD